MGNQKKKKIIFPSQKLKNMASQQQSVGESSLLVKIINKVDAMSKDEQHALWLRLNQKELLENYGFKNVSCFGYPSGNELNSDELINTTDPWIYFSCIVNY
jgi:hypothetical protein